MDWAPVLIMLLLAMLLPTTTTVFGLRAAQPQCPHNNTVGPNYVLTYLRLDLLVGQALVLTMLVLTMLLLTTYSVLSTFFLISS